MARQADGSYQATLCGHFTLTVAGDHPFRRRLLVLFLSLLDLPGAARGSRRTRGMGGHRSCGNCNWRHGWACRNRISVVGSSIGRRAIGPTYSAAQCRGLDGRVGRAHCRGLCHLSGVGRGAGVPTPASARGGGDGTPGAASGGQSGWRRLQQTLNERYDLSGPALALREGWLVGSCWRKSGSCSGAWKRANRSERSADHAGRPDDAGQHAGTLEPPPVKACPGCCAWNRCSWETGKP